jgi:hypothetical protein
MKTSTDYIYQRIAITPFGVEFVKTCMPDEHADEVQD